MGTCAGAVIGAALMACALCAPVAAASSGERSNRAAAATELSAQSRAAERPRIRVYPLPGPLRRECVAVFQERWIPQWGGWVLYPGQRCWWTRAPA